MTKRFAQRRLYFPQPRVPVSCLGASGTGVKEETKHEWHLHWAGHFFESFVVSVVCLPRVLGSTYDVQRFGKQRCRLVRVRIGSPRACILSIFPSSFMTLRVRRTVNGTETLCISLLSLRLSYSYTYAVAFVRVDNSTTQQRMSCCRKNTASTECFVSCRACHEKYLLYP